ncbi:MAG: sulfate adenylyltransferase subunit 1, partial [Flavobacteriales bacterium]
VDDGKSTLIGRLLFDTKSITKDRLEAVEAGSRRKGLDFTDLSLLTDGLIAEREQGITIDVAHIYFATPSRKYIIADSPGHVEYTRNMITGASHSEAFIVLIDARKGVIEQTRRHLFIARLLRIRTVFVCINKMDLAGFSETVFEDIRADVKRLAETIGLQSTLEFVPAVAKDGDNIALASERMPWYSGKTLLQHLEELPVQKNQDLLPARFPVQYVIRPHSDEHHDFRGYAGKLESGRLRKGQEVMALPSGRTAVIRALYAAAQEVDEVSAGQSITLELDADLDISRGNMIVAADAACGASASLQATLAWMDDKKLTAGSSYLLQHGIHTVKAKISAIGSRVNIDTLENEEGVNSFGLNDIGRVHIKTARPLFADVFAENPHNGAFILVDEFSNNTVAAGFIEVL